MSEQEHACIWLQPWCDGCEKHAYGGEGRMWCQDDVWGECEECGKPAVKYRLAPLQIPAESEQVDK